MIGSHLSINSTILLARQSTLFTLVAALYVSKFKHNFSLTEGFKLIFYLLMVLVFLYKDLGVDEEGNIRTNIKEIGVIKRSCNDSV